MIKYGHSNKRGQANKRGQGTVELVLTMFAFFTILFMYVQLAFSMAVGNFLHYATFMAARAFLPGRESVSDQKKAANVYFTRLLGESGTRFKGIAKPVETDGGGDVAGTFVGQSSRVKLGNSASRDTAWEQGATFKFKVKMYMLPLIKGGKKGEANEVTLESETWLGRDPSEQECLKILDGRAKKAGIKGVVLYDNGC